MKTIIEVRNLERLIPIKAGFLSYKNPRVVHAVDGVSLDIFENETLALVGESGCGKSTLGKTLLRLFPATGGQVFFKGEDILLLKPVELRAIRKDMQIVFQDIGASLNSRKTAEQIISQPLKNYHPEMSKAEIRAKVEELLTTVGLTPVEAYINRYPHEFSGGQRQRIGIARAIALSPRFIVADEPVSALDVSVRGQILNLFNQLKKDYNLTYLFITHDMSVVRSIADRVAVMYLGKIVELAAADDFFLNTLHPYSRAILSATPIADPEMSRQREIIDLKGELPSPVNVPSGCRFHNRCQYACELCSKEIPELEDTGDGHLVACFRCMDGYKDVFTSKGKSKLRSGVKNK